MPDQIFFTTAAALLVALGVPMARRRVKPNRWYGFRGPATFADEHVWYEANALAGRDLIALGTLLAVLALLLPHVVPITPQGYQLVCVAVLVSGSAISALRTWRYANRLRQARQGRGGGSGA